MTVAARRPSRNSFMLRTIDCASCPARAGIAPRLLPSVPWQAAQFEAMSRPRFAYGVTSAAKAKVVEMQTAATAAPQRKKYDVIAPSMLLTLARMPNTTSFPLVSVNERESLAYLEVAKCDPRFRGDDASWYEPARDPSMKPGTSFTRRWRMAPPRKVATHTKNGGRIGPRI